MAVRTRFAPSPTGHLHIGGARTALFNHLFTRHVGGAFILRIEDTDRERSTPESIAAIVDSLRWLDLDWDEGPFFQTERDGLHRARLHDLEAAGHLYRCYCSPEELATKRELARAAGRTIAYDRTCRERHAPAPDRSHVLRFRTPLAGVLRIDDLVKGPVVFDVAELDDFVVARPDGSPVYNFSAAIDDVDMGITHVIRGDDHLINTPRQALLYQALGAPLPRFAHVPMILGPDRTRLSKRHGATSVMAYRDQGYLPDALVNYLARLGWSHGDQELFTRQELIDAFSLEHVGRSAAIFNPEKLDWVNGQWLRRSAAADLVPPLRALLADLGLPDPHDDRWLERVVGTLQERAKTLRDLAEAAAFYLQDAVEIDDGAARKHLTPAVRPALDRLAARLAVLEPWTADAIESAFRAVLDDFDLKLGKLAQPVRVAVTGGTVSPGIFEVLDILGRERTLARLHAACGRMDAAAAASP